MPHQAPPYQQLLYAPRVPAVYLLWQVLRRLADGAMEPIPMSNLSFRPAADGSLNPLLLPIQLPYLLVDRIITRVESVLQLTAADRVGLRCPSVV